MNGATNPDFKRKLYCFFVIAIISVVGSIMTGERIVQYEHTQKFSFANPFYLFNMIACFCCLGIGSLSFIELHRLVAL